jgi:hypothetical protein
VTGVFSFSNERQEDEMKSVAIGALVLFLTAAPALAQKIYIDYDKDYDTSGIETFAWNETSETSVADTNPLLHSRIVNGIEYYLTLGGAREVTDSPDVYVTYHASTRKELSVDTTVHGYGYPSGWGYYGRRPYGYHGGYGTATTTVRTYDKGTLIVDVWDTASKQLVWRGTADNITVTSNPTKMEKRIDKALKKMVNKWQKIKASKKE